MKVQQALLDLVASANQLFSLPDIYFQLTEMIRDPRFSLFDMGEVISKDPALSARLLRLVNSSFYGFQSKIDTISRAITVVGIDELFNLIIATCVVDRFAKIPCELVDMTAFWMRSVHCAVVAKLLAKQSLVLQSERLFLAGLLHDIGSLVLYQKMPEQSRQVLIAIGHQRRMLAEFEKDIIGFTHADVGCELVKAWGLPETLYEPIGCYLHPETAKIYKLDAALLYIATRLVDSLANAESAEYETEDFSEQFLAAVNLNRIQLVSVFEQSLSEFMTVYEMVTPSKKLH